MSEKKKIMCKFYRQNVCKNGDRCNFSHDITAPDDTICKFYLRGSCAYGDKCRYDHVRERPNPYNLPQAFTSLSTALSSNISRDPASTSFKSLNKNTSHNTISGEMTTLPSSTLKQSKPTEEEERRNEELLGINVAMSDLPSSMRTCRNQFAENSRNKNGDLRSYAQATGSNYETDDPMLCPYHIEGKCPNFNCDLPHGDKCPYCQINILHPINELQRQKHISECLQNMEVDMHKTFEYFSTQEKYQAEKQYSQSLQCSICLETILNPSRDKSLRKFGLLQSCNHIFCIGCAMNWRESKTSDVNLEDRRKCPICRQPSFFVIPSPLFPQTTERKREIIDEYRSRAKEKHCMFYKRGLGLCSFGNSCWYLHADPSGVPVKGEAPHVVRRRMIDSRIIDQPDQMAEADENEVLRQLLDIFSTPQLPQEH